MIYTKRQIKTNSDRYGGFADDEIETSTQRVEARQSTIVDELLSGSATDKLVYDEPKRPAQSEPVSTAQKTDNLYTTRETLNNKRADAQSDRARLSSLDIVPSKKTLKYADDRADLENVVPQKKRKSNMDTRTKVLLSVYIVIAVALAVAVIATGVSIAGANAQSEELVNAIAQKQEYIVGQEALIGELTNEATVREEAIKNGMVYSGEPQDTVELLDKVEHPEPTEHTNGFDKFCDFVSGI